MHVLIIEDDRRLRRLMKQMLEEEACAVDEAGTGPDGLAVGLAGGFDVIVLDLTLPGLDGVSVCSRLREAGIDTPLLMLTARDALDDRVRGLNAGADDYLAKPFAFAELLARLRALARRRPVVESDVLRSGDLVLDPVNHSTRRGVKELSLTAREYALLRYLMRHAGQVLNREQILDQVWGYDQAPVANVVDLYVHYLRKKVDGGFDQKLIETVRGAGYRLRRLE